MRFSIEFTSDLDMWISLALLDLDSVERSPLQLSRVQSTRNGPPWTLHSIAKYRNFSVLRVIKQTDHDDMGFKVVTHPMHLGHLGATVS